MKAIRVSKTGGPEVLGIEEVDPPDPGRGEVRVRVRYSGVNFIDTYQRTGLYAVPLPFTPGSEGAGEVDAVGADVTEFRVGDRVAYASELGSYAEFAIVKASKLVAVPTEVGLDTAAAVMLQGMTAHYLTRDTFPLGPEQWALVHAAAGGVGLLLVQLARLRGARVIGTTSTEAKAELGAAPAQTKSRSIPERASSNVRAPSPVDAAWTSFTTPSARRRSTTVYARSGRAACWYHSGSRAAPCSPSIRCCSPDSARCF